MASLLEELKKLPWKKTSAGWLIPTAKFSKAVDNMENETVAAERGLIDSGGQSYSQMKGQYCVKALGELAAALDEAHSRSQ